MSEAAARPLVTFAVIAYNQERFIREAVEGAFAQTYRPLEIILSDDCSPDRTFEIMQEMAAAYDGPHRVRLNRNERNLGLASHFNNILSAASGEILVISAGDDISGPSRVEISVPPFLADPGVSFVETQFKPIQADGSPVSGSKAGTRPRAATLEDFVKGTPSFSGATRAYRLSALRAFPPLRRDCPTEASTMLLRSVLVGTGSLVDTKAVAHRYHDENLSSRDSLRAMKMSEIHRQYVDDLNHARRYLSLSLFRFAALRGALALWIFRRMSLSRYHSRKASRASRLLHFAFTRKMSAIDKLFIAYCVLARRFA